MACSTAATSDFALCATTLPDKVESGVAPVVSDVSSRLLRAEEEMSNGGSPVQLLSAENKDQMGQGPDKSVFIDQLKAKGLLTVLTVGTKPKPQESSDVKEKKQAAPVALVLTPRKEPKPEAAGLKASTSRRGHGAGGFKIATRTQVRQMSMAALSEEVIDIRNAHVDFEAQKETELAREWCFEVHHADDFDYEGHMLRSGSKRALIYVETSVESLRSCLAQYTAKLNYDEDLRSHMVETIRNCEACYDRIFSELDPRGSKRMKGFCVDWDSVHALVMMDAAEVAEAVDDVRSSLGDLADHFLPSIQLEKYRKDLPTSESVDGILIKRLAAILESNEFNRKYLLSEEGATPTMTMMDVYHNAQSQARDYLQTLLDSVSKPLKSAKDGLKVIKTRIASGEFTMNDLFAASGKVVTKLSEAAFAAFNLIGVPAPVNDMLEVLALQEKYNVTPDDIVEALEVLLRKLQTNDGIIEVPNFRPPKKNDYKCARCGSADHLVTFCPLSAKCSKCHCAGLQCRSSKENETGECDPFGLMALIEHFFFLELAKLTVDPDDIMILNECCSTVCDTTAKRFSVIAQIIQTSMPKKVTKSTAAAATASRETPVRLTETPAFKVGIAYPKCVEFLDSYRHAVLAARTAKEAAEQAALETRIAAEAAQAAAALAARTARAAAAASRAAVSESNFDILTIPSEIKADLLARFPCELVMTQDEDDVAEESEDDDEDSGDSVLAQMFGRPPDNHAQTFTASEIRLAHLKKMKKDGISCSEVNFCGSDYKAKKHSGGGHRGRHSDRE